MLDVSLTSNTFDFCFRCYYGKFPLDYRGSTSGRSKSKMIEILIFRLMIPGPERTTRITVVLGHRWSKYKDVPWLVKISAKMQCAGNIQHIRLLLSLLLW